MSAEENPIQKNDQTSATSHADENTGNGRKDISALLSGFQNAYVEREPEELSMAEFLEICSKDPDAYKSPAERLLDAIGEPEIIDTSRDPRLSRIHGNKQIKCYPAFKDFYGMENTVEKIVAHLKHAAQGLEESKQILYLLGPVGGGKSSLAERLKELMEVNPFYAIKGSPINESPLGLFDKVKDRELLESANVPETACKHIMSPWAVKRLKEFKGDVTQFRIVKRYPSKLEQVGISKTEPGDENNQDISALVGKVDIRQLEEFDQQDTDAYSYSGGLAHGNRGLMEFVEMFKAPIKVLHPLLTATQERNYNGTEAIGAIPFDGVVLAHSNESEWQSFRNNKTNEAFIDRVNIVKVPYCLRIDEEIKIYEKMIRDSSLSDAPCAPHTLEILAKFAVLTRLKEHENSSLYSKMRVYNGENLKDTDPRAKSVIEYKDAAGNDEGMSGFSTREAFKTLSEAFNANSGVEVAADPVRLMNILRTRIRAMDMSEDVTNKWLSYIEEYLEPQYIKRIGEEIQTAYMESYSEYGQNLFDRYVTYADFWIQDQEYRDPDTGHVMDREALDTELAKIEKPAGISNTKDFRNEIVTFVLRHRANHDGKNPDWTGYQKLRKVIEKKMFENTEDLLPVISSGAKRSSDDQKKHDDFVARMVQKGYTKSQVQLVSDYYTRKSPGQGSGPK